MGLCHTTTFHDVANAFPSTARGTLDTMVNECDNPEDRSLLNCRYGHTHVIIKGRGDKELVVKPRCGGLQWGHQHGTMFSAAYDTGMRAWEGQCSEVIGDGLWACDPMSGEPVQVGNTTHVDDAHETSVADTVEELSGVLHVSIRFLDKELTSRGLGRNGDTDEHLIQFRGRGCQEDAGGT